MTPDADEPPDPPRAHLRRSPRCSKAPSIPTTFRASPRPSPTATGELRYRVTALLDKQRRKVVSCIIEGFVFLTCQRRWKRSGTRFRSTIGWCSSTTKRSSRRSRRRATPRITWSRTSPLDVRDLVEDAVLLAAADGAAQARARGGAGKPGAKGRGEQSPFAALASLKKETDSTNSGEESWPYNRTRSRRRSAACTASHDHLGKPPVAVEPTTGETHLRHHISPSGYYRGKKVIQTKD